jgi:predicted N-formylglutamate amidohydrolase
MKPYHLIITCEHAVNTIPSEFEPYFAPHKKLLESHQGYDIGALEMAQFITKALKVPFFQATTSRLLIDTNRSLTHKDCFSIISKVLPEYKKQEIIDNYYQPYREAFLNYVRTQIQQGHTVLHLSIHSFTPVYKGKTRKGDIGLLYDTERPDELRLAKIWQKKLKKQAPDLFIRRNYPYFGKTDGLVSYCRTLFPVDQYVGFEIESNQSKLIHADQQKRFAELLVGLVK